MAWSNIEDGESGANVRTKLNTLGASNDLKAPIANPAFTGNGSIVGSFTAENLFANSCLLATGGGLRPVSDNVLEVGAPSLRWSVIYAGNGTINTSDEREKAWRGPLNAAERAAAAQLINEIGAYQWLADLEAVDGDKRLRFGLRAQQVAAVLQQNGLSYADYSFVQYDEWEATEELGIEAGDRWSIDSAQLAFFMLASVQQQNQQLEARLSALETK